MTKNNPKVAKSPTTKKAAAAKPAKQNKTGLVLALLRRDGGATLDEVVKATGWLPHTTRAMFTGLRKKGYSIDRTRAEGVTRYAITGEPTA